MLYPNELRAHLYGRGGEIRTPDILLPKQARYQTALHPVYPSQGRRGNDTQTLRARQQKKYYFLKYIRHIPVFLLCTIKNCVFRAQYRTLLRINNQ